MLKRSILLLIIPLFLSCNSGERFEAKDGTFFLKDQLDRIELLIKSADEVDTTISKASVGWHLDHMLKVINNIYDSLEISDPSKYESNFNFRRMIVFTTGNIPRGIAKAPKSALPPEVILDKSIFQQMNMVKAKLKRVSSLKEKAYFNHPTFGQLNRNQALEFIEIHTNHHLKIIADILTESSS